MLLFLALDVVHNHAETVAHVDDGGEDGGPGLCLEDQTGRVLPVPDAEGMHLDFRLLAGDGRADLQHVGAHVHAAGGVEVVGIVLHKGGAAVQVRRHGLHNPAQRGDLPVTLRAEPVALPHQVLRGEPGQLAKLLQVFKVGVERAELLLLHEFFKRDLFPRLIPDGFDVFRIHGIESAVLVHLRVDFSVGHAVHQADDVFDAVSVNLPAELYLGFDLVALGDGHVAHVVADAQHAQPAAFIGADRGAHPSRHAPAEPPVFPPAGNHLLPQAHPRGDKPVLAVAVGGLVQVHEVHVDAVPRDVSVELRVDVQQGLLKRLEAADPHLGRRKRVHPGNHAGAGRVVVRLHDGAVDFFRISHDRMENDRAGNRRVRVEAVHHGPGVFVHPAEHVRAVQVLAADEKIEFIFLQRCHDGILPPFEDALL